MRLLQVSNSGFETPVIASHRTRQERDLEQGEHGAEPEPSPPASSSQRLSSKLRRSLFPDSALPFKDKGVQTPEPSEAEADSQLGSEPINDAINEAKDKKDDEENEKNAEKNVHGTKENNDEKTNKNSPNESTDGTQKSDKKKDQKEKDKEKKPEDLFFPRFLVFLGLLGPLLSSTSLEIMRPVLKKGVSLFLRTVSKQKIRADKRTRRRLVTGCVPSRLQLRPVAGSFASTYGLDVSFFGASCLVALSENRVRQIQSLIITIFHDNICHKYIYICLLCI